jgi:hypothetical protein
VGFLGVVVEVTLAIVPDDLVFRDTKVIPLEVRGVLIMPGQAMVL